MTENLRREWAQTLSKSLKRWINISEFPNARALGVSLGIPESPWNILAYGKAVTTNTEYYAQLFVRTGLKEADPRTIPDRRQKTPHNSEFFVTTAWSDEKFNSWYEREGYKYLPNDKANPISNGLRSELELQPEIPPPKTQPQVLTDETIAQATQQTGLLEDIVLLVMKRYSTPVIQAITESVMIQLEPKIQEAIAASSRDDNQKQLFSAVQELTMLVSTALQQIDEPVRRPAHTVIRAQNVPKDIDPGNLARMLRKALLDAVNGSIEDRNSLSERYGHDFGRLLTLLDAFTSDHEDRERLLVQQGRLDGNANTR